MQKQHILVTGGLGYVGTRLVDHLCQQKRGQLRVLDLGLYLTPSEKWLTDRHPVEIIRGDIRDPNVAKPAMLGIDTVIHLAAISNDPTGNVDEVLTRQVNFDGTANLVLAAKAAGVNRFINASSSSVYGVNDNPMLDESVEPAPLTAYSKTKHMAEWVVRAANAPDFVTVNVRPATICGYSPRQRFDLVVNKLTGDAVTKGVITVEGGNQRRPHVTITDIVRFYDHLTQAPDAWITGRTFNVGFENETVLQTAQRIAHTIGSHVKIEIKPVRDPRDYHICGDRCKTILGFTPVSTIEQEVAELRDAIVRGEFNPDNNPHHNLRFITPTYPGRNPAANFWAAV